MSIYHDEIEIEDFNYDEEEETYFYPCPCGDRFQITKVITGVSFSHMCLVFVILHSIECNFQEELQSGVDVATCPSCSLVIKVIYDKVRRSCNTMQSMI